MTNINNKGININKIIAGLPVIKRIISLSKRIIPPGFDGVSLYDASTFFIKNMNKVNLADRSAAVTYNFLIALPPTLLFLFTLVPYLPLVDVQLTILNTLKLIIINPKAYHTVSNIINDFLNNQQRSLLSFSLLLTIFYSSEGVMGLMRYFDRDQTVYIARSGFKRRWEAIKLTLLLIGVVLLSIVAIIIQTRVVNELILDIFGNIMLIKVLSLLFIFFIIFCTISCIYIYGPSLTHRFRFFSTGAIFACFLCVISSGLFFYIANHFIHYNKVYGSIGSIIAFFAWLSINTRIIMLGYDLNVSILMGKIENSAKILKNRD